MLFVASTLIIVPLVLYNWCVKRCPVLCRGRSSLRRTDLRPALLSLNNRSTSRATLFKEQIYVPRYSV